MAGSARPRPPGSNITSTATWRPGGPKTRPFRFGLEEASTDDEALAAGSMVGDRYRIVRLLGSGGMGHVYEAEHVTLLRRVALKLLRKTRHSSEHLARFRQEAEAASRVGHPAIVDVVDFARLDDGQVYLAMEMLQGENLEDWLSRSGRLADGLKWLAEIACGLDAAHRAGVVHRDIKPQNLFLHRGPDKTQPKILDFGIAKVTTTDHTRIETQAGTVLGTPYYLAPERALGRPLTAAADLYSLGVILYEMLTGTIPFDDKTFMGVLAQHVRVRPLDPRQAAPDRGISDGVALLAMALLEKDPARRPASAARVAERIEQLLQTERAAIEAVQTGPRTQAPADQKTVDMLAQAERPTTAPSEGAVRGPQASTAALSLSSAGMAARAAADEAHATPVGGGTREAGPMMAFADGPAVRTRFETSYTADAKQPPRRRKAGIAWFGAGVVVVALVGVAAWAVAAMRGGQPPTDPPSSAVTTPASTRPVDRPVVDEAPAIEDSVAAAASSGPAPAAGTGGLGEAAEGGTTASPGPGAERPEPQTDPQTDPQPDSQTPSPTKTRTAPKRRRTSPKTRRDPDPPDPPTQSPGPGLPALKDDVYD